MKNIMNNKFIQENIMGEGTAFTENGAVSYKTTGAALIDQFGKAGTARARSIETVWAEQSLLWAENSEMALKFPFYLRMITRQSNLVGGEKTEKVQKGQGNRDESFKRLLWIAKYHPEEFYRNLWILPAVGSWKDLWALMAFDGASEYLKNDKFFEVIAEGINDDNHRDLVKKFMPRIRSEKKCTTAWAKKTNELAKEFAKFAGWSFKDYREFKATGLAHKFQTVICKGLYKDIDWKTIPGQALLNLVTGKFLKNHNLENSYLNWIKAQPVAKFNGYPYQLGMKLDSTRTSLVEKITIDKQFDGLIATAKKDNGGLKGNILVGLDTSGSMTSPIEGGPDGLTTYDVCVSLGIYFSELNEGAFHNTVAMFDDYSWMMTLKGSFSDKWSQIKHSSTAWGSTNFQSLIDLIVNTRKNNPSIPLEDFPKTLLVVSDMQFNPSMSWRDNSTEKTNYELAMTKLRSVFPEDFVKDFKIIWWYCTNRTTKDYPTTMEHGGSYMVSGFDGAIISLILGGEYIDPITGEKVTPTMEEVVYAALNQEVLTLVR